MPRLFLDHFHSTSYVVELDGAPVGTGRPGPLWARMLGFVALVVGRLFAAEWKKLNVGTVIIAAALVIFYAGGWAI